jgi:hypothetical protein
MDVNGFGMQQDAPPSAYIPRETFSVGGVLGTGFKIWLKNFLPFAVVTAVAFLPFALWFYFSGIENYGKTNAAILSALLSMVCQGITTAAVTYGVVMSLRQTPASIGECLVKGLARAIPSIVVSILMGLCVGLAALAFVIPGLIVATVLYVAVPASVIESPGIGGSFSRSSYLTAGNRWGIFGIIVMLMCVSYGSNRLLEGTIFPWLVQGSTSVTGIKLKISLALITQQMLVATFTAVLASVAYYLLRSEKEGTGIDQIGAVFD